MRDIYPVKKKCIEKYSFSYWSSSVSLKLDSMLNMNEDSCSDHKIKSGQTKVKCSSENKPCSELKSKYGVSYANKSVKVAKQHPLSKRKDAPFANNLTNASAKVVLFERNVEIKDLESKVKYLENKIKELQNENRTVQSLQSRQERELKKFKEGVADIPSLLRGHREEIKTYESTLSSIRKELRDCLKELKLRHEAILKKDSQIDKLNVLIKQNGKNVQYLSHEIKELRAVKKDLEEENRMLVGANQNLKCENDGLCRKVKDLRCLIENLEENLSKETNANKQLKIDMKELQLKDEVRKHEASGDMCNLSEEPSNHIPERKDTPEKMSLFSEGDGEVLENLLADEVDVEVLQNKQLGDKGKDALLHTIKRYQEYQDYYDKNCTRFGSVVSSEIKGSKLKLLPPLKQPCKQHSQKTFSFISHLNKEISSATDISLKDGSKSMQCDKLSKDLQHKSRTDVLERNKPENRTVVSEEKTKKNKHRDIRELREGNDLETEFGMSWLDEL